VFEFLDSLIAQADPRIRSATEGDFACSVQYSCIQIRVCMPVRAAAHARPRDRHGQISNPSFYCSTERSMASEHCHCMPAYLVPDFRDCVFTIRDVCRGCRVQVGKPSLGHDHFQLSAAKLHKAKPGGRSVARMMSSTSESQSSSYSKTNARQT
jgi:hypothetical protein